MADDYQRIPLHQLPVDAAGYMLADLYIFMPASNHYVRFVAAGNLLTEAKLKALQKHPTPHVFISADIDLKTIFSADNPIYKTEALQRIGIEQKAAVTSIYRNLLGKENNAYADLNVVATTADQLLEILAPEALTIKEQLILTAKFFAVMNDASAITTIAVLCAFACDFNSKRSFRDLALACLFMDVGLTDVPTADLRNYYCNRSVVSESSLNLIREHPQKAYDLVKEKYTTIGDAPLHLILAHHELFNGKGFPNGIRTESLFPMTKVLALAVDIFETLKGAHFDGQEMTLFDAALKFKEEGQEAHMRRHSKKLVDALLNFIVAA